MIDMSRVTRFWGLFVVLIIAGALVNSWALLGEAHVERKELKNFPTQVGTWTQKGVDQRLDEQTMSVLKASDYLLRDYHSTTGQFANYYVGYYASQRDGSSFHSPLNCLPGSGWTMTAPGTTTVTLDNGKTFEANKYVIENEGVRQLMLYWYQGRGRVVVNEYWGKVFTVLDSISMRRSDAAMVRITVPVTTSDDDALNAAKDFAKATSLSLPEFVPN
jgi:EpsI family protein